MQGTHESKDAGSVRSTGLGTAITLFSLLVLFPAAWPDKTGDEQVSCFVFTNI